MSSPQMNYQAPPPGNKSGILTALAGAGIVAALACNGFLLYQVSGLRDESAHAREVIQGEIDTLKENSTAMTAAQRKHLDELKDDLDTRSRQLAAQANQAKREAVSYADEQSKRLESEQAKTNQQVSQVSSAVTDVSKKADTANAKIADVGNDVSGVKTDLAGTKTALDQTKTELSAALKKVQGDLGVTNGFVATNGKELEELKKLGERNYVEFTLKKQKDMQKVANISLKLDKADPKKNKFTLNVMADDKMTEKKDRNINEPLQFYVSKALYEIVINSVGKDTVTGYLASPKYQSR
jgi:hypothetical protein